MTWTRDWTCSAYGDELPEACFFPEHCRDAEDCKTRMVAERKRLFQRMQTLSTTDPLWADLSEDFPTPESLLGGEDSEP